MPADALKCKECSTTYPLDARYVCERCFGPLEVAYRASDASPEELKRRIQAGPHSLWRYADFLPLEGPARSALPTGWTPLVKADRLAQRLGLRELYIKNETANPTHSFKDRVVSVALARARELGMVHDVVPAAEVEKAASALARTIADNAPLSLAGMKATIQRTLAARAQIPHADLDELTQAARQSADASEGRRAMLEKRKPNFRGE